MLERDDAALLVAPLLGEAPEVVHVHHQHPARNREVIPQVPRAAWRALGGVPWWASVCCRCLSVPPGITWLASRRKLTSSSEIELSTNLPSVLTIASRPWPSRARWVNCRWISMERRSCAF